MSDDLRAEPTEEDRATADEIASWVGNHKCGRESVQHCERCFIGKKFADALAQAREAGRRERDAELAPAPPADSGERRIGKFTKSEWEEAAQIAGAPWPAFVAAAFAAPPPQDNARVRHCHALLEKAVGYLDPDLEIAESIWAELKPCDNLNTCPAPAAPPPATCQPERRIHVFCDSVVCGCGEKSIPPPESDATDPCRNGDHWMENGRCTACGASEGAWKPHGDPMQKHIPERCPDCLSAAPPPARREEAIEAASSVVCGCHHAPCDHDEMKQAILAKLRALPRSAAPPPRTFRETAANALADACERAVRAGKIDGRSEIADALLDYRDERPAAPPPAERQAPCGVTTLNCPKHQVPMIATMTEETLCAVCEKARADALERQPPPAEPERRIRELEREVAIDDKLLAERNALLEEFPCPAHGPCIPYVRDRLKILIELLRALGHPH